MDKTFKDYLQEAGAPDYNPAAGRWASNMEYGMFTPDGDAEVEEIVNDACAMVKAGKTDAMGAVDAAMRMLTTLAEMTDFEEAEDTDVRNRVAREIMSRCDELEESDMEESKSEGSAWYIEQDAKEMAERDGHVWSRLPYGYKEDYRKKAKAKRTNEATVDENAFNQAAAAAARAGKDTFEFGGKTHKTTMNKNTAHKLDDDIDMLRKLAGLR